MIALRLLLITLLFTGCQTPFRPLPPTEVDKLAQQYNAVVIEKRDLESGMYQTYARLLDESKVWRSNGRNVTDCFQSKEINRVVANRRLIEAMQQGVEGKQIIHPRRQYNIPDPPKPRPYPDRRVYPAPHHHNHK